MGEESTLTNVTAVNSATTLGITSDEGSFATETISNSSVKLNPFLASAEEMLKTVNSKDSKIISAFGLQQRPQTTGLEQNNQTKVAQTVAPSFANILLRGAKDVWNKVNAYDRAFNGSKLANRVLPSESEIYDVAHLPQIQAVLYQMHEEYAS